ncbi:MAG TPA: class I SAM-dependent methyltransferase [Chloroflexia bacterium]|nr:class I SAM-dependent methyltransferase [Chloroflexia bacterium]
MDADNPYIFGDPATDRQRLETQNAVFSDFLRANLRRVAGPDVHSILDVGCGEGQMDPVLRELYPHARIVGVDKDERAIARARSTADELGLVNIEYQACDVEHGLPPGPFDLIYASFVLLHTHRPDRVVAAMFAALRPGGCLWVKDLHPGFPKAINLRAYQRLADMLLSAMAGLGVHPHLASELPGYLTAEGFVEITEQAESYPLGGATPLGQAMLATVMGVFYNSRGMISKVHKVAESEIERLYFDVCNTALRNSKELGTEAIANITARRPAA